MTEDGPSTITLRQALQSATHEVHERLHLHPGLAAVRDETITREDYVRLLGRLYGFYAAFEAAALLPPLRSEWLERDLAAFGVSELQRAGLPICGGMPDVATPETLLGALYVVEGSALGGVALARHLGGIVGDGALDGRRFFSGRQAETGAAWRDYLARLSTASGAPKDQAAIIVSAGVIFALFERWLEGWNDRS